jgi:peptidoglycan hydrolase-like protein with peptidoglycan-binding domain
MSRSLWAAAGACALALATVPGVALAKTGDGSSRSDTSRTPATATPRSGRSQLRHHHHRARKHRRRPAVRAGHRGGHLLVPGSGYQQAAGSAPVRSLQRQLAHLGFAPGPIDGRYGPRTTHAVERFQAAAGLTIDGIAGPHTLTAVNATRHAALAPGVGYAQPAGSRRVRSLQRRLVRLGFTPGPVDGRYGPRTRAGVRRFQRMRHLLVTGVAGVPTLVALRSSPHRTAPRTSPASVQPPATAQAQAGSQMPVGAVLLGLALLGMAALAHSYHKTRRQRPAQPAQRRPARHHTTPTPPADAGARPTPQPPQRTWTTQKPSPTIPRSKPTTPMNTTRPPLPAGQLDWQEVGARSEPPRPQRPGPAESPPPRPSGPPPTDPATSARRLQAWVGNRLPNRSTTVNGARFGDSYERMREQVRTVAATRLAGAITRYRKAAPTRRSLPIWRRGPGR